MKYLPLPAILIGAALFVGCSASNTVLPGAEQSGLSPSAVSASTVANDTILLVSLDDGTVVMQTIQSDADLCFKKNSESSTTCLTKGEPVYDPATNAVVGIEMVEHQIDLIAKTD